MPYSRVLAEKNAKNKAYRFILSNGLLDQYAGFCENYPRGGDPYRDCLEELHALHELYRAID